MVRQLAQTIIAIKNEMKQNKTKQNKKLPTCRTWCGINGLRKQKLRSNWILILQIKREIDLLRLVPPFQNQGSSSSRSTRLGWALQHTCSILTTIVLCRLVGCGWHPPLFDGRWRRHCAKSGTPPKLLCVNNNKSAKRGTTPKYSSCQF